MSTAVYTANCAKLSFGLICHEILGSHGRARKWAIFELRLVFWEKLNNVPRTPVIRFSGFSTGVLRHGPGEQKATFVHAWGPAGLFA